MTDSGATSELLKVSRRLSRSVARLTFARPVAYVYNPLEYAWPLHAAYLRRFGNPIGRILLLGMNPGPWGMAQTGVPFGEIAAVRDWMGLAGRVSQPRRMHPKRPVAGLACQRSEVSGRRLWDWAARICHTADAFFKSFFVLNYCPLMFLNDRGANLTPDRLAVSERQRLFEPCNDALRRLCEILRPRIIIGVGAFATKRARDTLGDGAISIEQALHPSPASPAANRGWLTEMDRLMVRLTASGIIKDKWLAPVSEAKGRAKRGVAAN